MSKLPNLLEMLEAGMHFGHRTGRWHPKMQPYIFGERGGVHVIDLEKTAQKLAEALEFVKQLTAEGKTILFLGTKKQAQPIIKREAERCGMPYLAERWFGGMLTNFGEIGRLISRYRSYKTDLATGELEKYTKKERTRMAKEFGKVDTALSGVVTLMRVPDALYIIDLRKEKTAVREAKSLHMPTVAITDTNVNPEEVTHPIPCNDDAIKGLELMTKLVADAVLEGKELHAAAVAEAAKKVAEQKAAAAPPAPEQSRVKEEAPA